MLPLSPLSHSPAAPTGRAGDPALRAAAAGVEAMFLRQMLAAARQTALAGEDELFTSAGDDTFAELRDATFADLAAEADTLGLTRLFADQLGAAGD